MVEIAKVHFGSFWEPAGKIVGNSHFTHQYLFPAQSQFRTDFNDSTPRAAVFLGRCSEEMLIFNDAFLWSDG